MVAPGGEAIGVDAAEGMVRSARADPAARGLPARYLRMDVADLLFPDHVFDGAACGHGLHLVAEPLAALRELRRVLQPGRLLAASVPATVDRHPVVAIVEAFLDREGGPISEGRSTPIGGTDLKRLALAAGFRSASTRRVDGTTGFSGAPELARAQLSWWSNAERLGSPGGRRLAELTSRLASELEHDAGPPPYELPSASTVVVARS
jgi:SAM-dependent methyltransferase